jgi:hypothetical protein
MEKSIRKEKRGIKRKKMKSKERTAPVEYIKVNVFHLGTRNPVLESYERTVV